MLTKSQGKVKWDVYKEYAKASNLYAVAIYLVTLIGAKTAEIGKSASTPSDCFVFSTRSRRRDISIFGGSRLHSILRRESDNCAVRTHLVFSYPHHSRGS